jgi:hypothetical protein
MFNFFKNSESPKENSQYEYKTQINRLNKQLKKLNRQYLKEYKKIEKARWETINGLAINRIEGILNLKGKIYEFKNIESSDIIEKNASRIETIGDGKTKKKASIGGAVTGGLILGPLGVVAGATLLGKKKNTFNVSTVEILTCEYLAVNIYFKDKTISTIELLKTRVDQSDRRYLKSIEVAREIHQKIFEISNTRIDENNVLLISEEKSLKELNENIEFVKNQIKSLMYEN